MTVRAKFNCTSNTDGNVSFQPVYGGSPENDKFFAATPGGSISLSVVNKPAAESFEVGKPYYVDFTPAE